jgi:hypothetical protein
MMIKNAGVIGLAVSLALMLSSCSGDGDAPPPSVVTVTATTTPTASSTPEPSATPKKERAHSRAKFTHFVVTIDDLQRKNSSEVRLLAKVCVRSLPPDPQGDRTRISWDPWSVRAAGTTIKADPAHSEFKGAFPPDHTYRVGQCAKGWVPFLARGEVSKIKYANGVGDVAVWDAKHLDRKPEIRARSTSTKPSKPQRSASPKPRAVTPGAFCEPEGATGRTSAGTPMICTSKGPGTRPRWRSQ